MYDGPLGKAYLCIVHVYEIRDGREDGTDRMLAREKFFRHVSAIATCKGSRHRTTQPKSPLTLSFFPSHRKPLVLLLVTKNPVVHDMMTLNWLAGVSGPFPERLPSG